MPPGRTFSPLSSTSFGLQEVLVWCYGIFNALLTLVNPPGLARGCNNIRLECSVLLVLIFMITWLVILVFPLTVVTFINASRL